MRRHNFLWAKAVNGFVKISAQFDDEEATFSIAIVPLLI